MIEMPRFTFLKYEIKNDTLVIDRILDKHVPYNYGYVLQTLATDGDPLDIFLLDWQEIQSRSMASATILGAFKCMDNGVEDHKLIGSIDEFKVIDEQLGEIEKYLKTYKKDFQVLKYVDRVEAEKIYEECKR